MGYWKIELKKGLGKPIYVYADSHEMAEKMGLAEFKRTSGYAESVDTYSTVKNTIESVTFID